jgi:hypothetical protein
VTRTGSGDVYASMKTVAVIPLAALLGACGSATHVSRSLGPAPRSGKISPPPAWIETKGANKWLGFSSYCWRSGNSGVCADAIAPRCGLKGIPDVTVSEGETVRAHLGYDVDEASIEGTRTELEGRVASWRVDRNGPFLLFTKGKNGDASYVACARFG